ncbi:hydroxyethylthiazole kinase [Candidatus Neptunochlamydia vexilliferae]|uniref:Hydroxyethylthiazole kinase n=1 Tax=Candidatus Neptunichlamydia vexilliferae TaxID=1651774 RepID=A0ABS0AZG8_9BACT|nr:hydroxyethylthiazole kinase [Candidatus Neptunochlamydia vexilliferae]MBF5059523.1 Hydroxyethylthiazole kinase [Candidatus Neptunochlamydia vexilliferae]
MHSIYAILGKIRETKPLVLNITNTVTMDLMANGLLAIGAAPIMSSEVSEIKELVHLSQGVNINIGTLDKAFCKRAKVGAKEAYLQGKPCILDPVGTGATKIRTKLAKKLLPYVTTIKGNGSEILSFKDTKRAPLGVESKEPSIQAEGVGRNLSKTLNRTMIITGKVDIIIGGDRTEYIKEGSPLMGMVTGMGCTLGALLAAFQAVEKDRFKASLAATRYFGICGAKAAEQAGSPAAFKSALIDHLYELSFNPKAIYG